MKLNYWTLGLAAVVFAVILKRFWGMPWDGMHVAGLALIVPSFVMLAVARIQLGEAFSVEARATRLVTTGLYSRVRNPIYVSSMLLLIGLALWVQKPWYLVALVVVIPMQVARARKEAQALEAQFGEEYLAYRRRTWL